MNNFAQSSLANKQIVFSAFHRLHKIFLITTADRAAMAGLSTIAAGSSIPAPTNPSNSGSVDRLRVLRKPLFL